MYTKEKNMMKKTFIIRNITAVTTGLILFLSNISIGFASSNLTELEQEIITHMKNRETSFVLNYSGPVSNLSENLQTALDNAIAYDDYLKLSCMAVSTKAYGTIGDIDITFKASYLTTKEQEDMVTAKVKEVLSQIITPNMTEKQKIKAIHAYIINNVDYDYTLQKESAYTALFEEKTVCRGYALLFEKMTEEAGIQSIIIDGYLKGEGHAWNMVNTGGNWYHVDSTNDDTGIKEDTSSNTKVYYMVTDDVLHNKGFTWETGQFPSAVTVYSEEELPAPAPVETKAPTETQSPAATKAPAVSTVSKTDSPNIRSSNTYIEKALKTDNLSYLDKAQTYINKISDEKEKAKLQNKIQEVKITIKNNIIQNANKAKKYINSAKKLKTESSMRKAKEAVNKLPDSNSKSQLLSELKKVEKVIEINNLTLAKTFVQNARKQRTNDSIKKALEFVNKLKSSNEKQNLLKELKKLNN